MLRWILGPLIDAGRRSQPPERSFSLTDLIWLLLQMQMAMALVAAVFPADMPTRVRASAVILSCIPVLPFWLASLVVVSRAGIRRPLRRAAVFVIVLPGVALTVLGLPAVSIGLLSVDSSDPSEQIPTLVGLFAGLLALFLSLRTIAQWACAADSTVSAPGAQSGPPLP